MSDFRCDPTLGRQCKNNALCHLCDGERLLKLPKPKTPLKSKGPKKKKEGMDFEKKVARTWNRAATQGPARRQPNSGAIRDLPGDIVTPHELMECKERGTTTSTGAKNFTIQLDWIVKAEGEMFRSGRRHWYIPFGFKGHDDIYVIKSFEHELELLQTIEALKQRIKDLEE